MALGFDFDQFMGNPLAQMGIGMLGQQRQFGDSMFAPVARGALQGMGNYQNVRRFQQDQQMNALTMAATAAEEERKKRQLEARMALVERIRKTAPQPRPLAFAPQAGDPETLQQFNEANIAADTVAAGGSPDAYLTRLAQRGEREAARVERGEQLAVDRQERALRHGETMEERRLARQSMAEFRNAQLAQAKALREMASGNIRPVEVYDETTGRTTLVHPSQSYGQQSPPRQVSLTNEQKRQQAIAALAFAEEELKKLDKMITANPRSIGPAGYVARGFETAKGVVSPQSKTPALDVRNEQLNIIASVRKRLTDANASNRDIAQTLEIIGGGVTGTAGASSRSIETLRNQLKAQSGALGRAAPVGATNLPRPKTQAEFDKLPKGAVYIDPEDGKQYRKP